MKKITAIVLLLTMLFLMGCSQIKSLKTLSTEDTSKSNISTEQDVDPVFNVGEESTLNDWSITVLNVETVDEISINDYVAYTPDVEGNKYLSITLSVTNNGTESATFLPSFSTYKDVRAKIYYQSEYEYTPSTMLGCNDDMHDSTLNPLSSKTGIIAFSVPDSVATSTEELILRISDDGNYIDYKIR